MEEGRKDFVVVVVVVHCAIALAGGNVRKRERERERERVSHRRRCVCSMSGVAGIGSTERSEEKRRRGRRWASFVSDCSSWTWRPFRRSFDGRTTTGRRRRRRRNSAQVTLGQKVLKNRLFLLLFCLLVACAPVCVQAKLNGGEEERKKERNTFKSQGVYPPHPRTVLATGHWPRPCSIQHFNSIPLLLLLSLF